ncbi:MAG: capsular polysaccharide biosynthesis protein [Candidatus Berkelbacteria bacterium Athens1014_28]|uniref:Capsular polysaccharide biosynthesis protein n=1 Tax=Candidatus Berkelbacteria bacterium Athens1014_28 TaxID=2017145 RepID=A0A554LL96_9BACT|nr:MAG: capsular polysaccharide biosynthesis protein [Candidatus Berkelbacteria bacterium Athens1014_28]
MSETGKLFKNSSIVFVGTIVGSVFSYLFNMLMGRQLGPKSYGEMTALLSLLSIISVFGGAILTVAMRYFSEFQAEGDLRRMKKLLALMTRNVYFLSVGILLVLFALIKPISGYLLIDNYLPVGIAFSCLVFGLVIMVNKGFLQGVQKFSATSTIGALETFLRLTLGLLLVYFGLGLNGALSAIVLASAICYFVTFFPIQSAIAKMKIGNRAKKSYGHFNKADVVKYLIPAALSSGFLALLLNLDIILVKHYFSPADAGVYSAVSTIAKIILYATAPVISVMFPMISEKQVTFGSFIILGIYALAPAKIIQILYGKEYISLFYLLPEIGLAIVLYSVINLFVNYYLAIKKFFFLWFFLLAIIFQLVAISFFHDSILIVVRLLILTFLLLFLLLFGYYIFGKRKQILSLILEK